MTDSSPITQTSPPEPERPLESWKAIATYLKRDVRTAKRWEACEGLPVHRHLHKARSSVYSYPGELDAWRSGRQPLPEPPAGVLTPRTRAVALVAMVLCTFGTSSGRLVSTGVSYAAAPQNLALRQVWTGADVDLSGSVSPDGRLLSFVDWSTGDLAVRTIATGETRRLTDKGPWSKSDEMAIGSVFAPDGRHIAYGWMPGAGKFEVRLISLDGTGGRVLYRPDVGYSEPKAWSPDGTHILTVSLKRDQTAQMVLVSVADGSARLLKEMDWRRPGTAVYSPDGKYIAYDFPPQEGTSQKDIFLIAADGSHEMPLVQHAADDRLLGWAPDGLSLFMISDRAGTADCWRVAMAGAVAQGAPALVKRDVGRVAPLGFTRDGTLFYGLATGMTDVYTALVDLASGTLLSAPKQIGERFVGANTFPVWTSDGATLGYVSARGRANTLGSKTFVSHPVSGGQPKELPLKNLISFRPYGRCGHAALLIGVGVERDRVDIYLIDARSGDLTRIVQGELSEGIMVPACSPDGRVAYFERLGVILGRRPRIVARDLSAGTEKVLYQVPQEGDTIQSLAVSPDGALLAFSLTTREGNRVHLIPAAGGEIRELSRMAGLVGGVLWTPDGRQVLFARREGSGGQTATELWSVPFLGGEPRRVANVTMPRVSQVQLHPDGRQIAFTAGESKAEVWVMDGLLK